MLFSNILFSQQKIFHFPNIYIYDGDTCIQAPSLLASNTCKLRDLMVRLGSNAGGRYQGYIISILPQLWCVTCQVKISKLFIQLLHFNIDFYRSNLNTQGVVNSNNIYKKVLYYNQEHVLLIYINRKNHQNYFYIFRRPDIVYAQTVVLNFNFAC